MKVIETGKKLKWTVSEQDDRFWLNREGDSAQTATLYKENGFTSEDAQALCDRKNGEERDEYRVKSWITAKSETWNPDVTVLSSKPIAIITGDLSRIEGPYSAAKSAYNNLTTDHVFGVNYNGEFKAVKVTEIIDALNLLHQLKQ